MVQMVQKSPKYKKGPKLSDMVQNGPNFPYAFLILKFQKDTFFWDTLYVYYLSVYYLSCTTTGNLPLPLPYFLKVNTLNTGQ